jgi:aryl-alcohol dehydrogenase-like predicted oxidoreductase
MLRVESTAELRGATMGLSRRQFLQVAAAGSLAAPALGAAPKLPTRMLGKTGLEVSIVGFGSGSRFLMYAEEDQALAALSGALDQGITYIDTAHSYGNGKSEERIGRLMPERRKQVVLATKLSARTADDARRQIELSLRRLQTDRLDVVHIHALSGLEDLAAIEKPDGILKALYEARDQKTARAIGITCHAAPDALNAALERHDFDCTQMALNAAMARMAQAPGGMKATPMSTGGFEELALPVAVRKGMGVIAMKVFAQDQIVGAAPIEKLLTYALSLPVSLASLGMPKVEFIARNIELARTFTPMPANERRRLTDSIAAEHKVSLATYFSHHRDV